MSLAMSAPSEASLSRSDKDHIRGQYNNRCAICLSLFPKNSIQAARMIDSASLDMAVMLEILTADYQTESSINSMAQCGSCHSYFTQNYIALSPPIPVLNYIHDYLINTPTAFKKPLHQVFDLLQRARTGENVTLPDPTPILPFLGLFTIVVLRPDELLGCVISTRHQPVLSRLQDNRFLLAPHGTSSAGRNVARIFDVLSIAATPSTSRGDIPLSPQHAEFQQQRYWRLPVSINAVLAVLIDRTANFGNFESPEIEIAQNIFFITQLQRRGYILSKPLPTVGPGGGGGSGGGPSGHGGGGRSGRGRGPSGNEGTKRRGGHSGGTKRVLRSSDRDNPPPKKGKTNMNPSDGLGEPDVSKSHSGRPDKSELSDRSNSERIHHGVNPDEWEVGSSFSYDERLQTKVLSENSIATHTSSKPESEGGIDDPKKWRFGPSYRSDMIIVTARGISLV